MALNEEHIRKHIRRLFLTELTGKFKDQVEIIYRDKNIVCLIPKSQMTSHIYGQKAKWCQVDKSGFNMWSKQGLLIRFLLKSGRKIRFTYYFKNSRQPQGAYYWANENGFHVLEKEGNNPFNATPLNPNKVRDTEEDILNIIQNDIPLECKEKVLEFIKKNQESYDYCYNDDEYVADSVKSKRAEFHEIYDAYDDILGEIYREAGHMVSIYFNNSTREFGLSYLKNHGQNNNYITTKETFKDKDVFLKRLLEIINEFKKDLPNVTDQAAE